MAKRSLLLHTARLHHQRDISKESDAAPRIRTFPIPRSLLYRASQVKGYALSPRIIDFSHPERPIQADGIDGKDAQEIQAHIEALSHKNRITLKSEELTIIPTKNGVVFPVVVNSLMLGIAAAALLLISQIVTGDRVQSTYEGGFASVEGQIIQQMRQDSELRLSEKEQEIAAIRKQLASLKSEELTAVNKFEELHKQRERELQTRLEQDMADERKRLNTTGVSAEDREALLAAYEQKRSAYYRAALDRYQVQLEAEQEAERANYQQLQDKYQQDLRNLNEQRRLIKEALAQNENQVRLSMEEGRAMKADPRGEGNAALEEARAKLVLLQEQQQQALVRDNHIIGMYAAIRTSLEQEHYRDALVQAESLIRYLEETLEDPLGSQRRSLDRYAAGALARIARTELTRTREPDPQSANLEAQIGLLSADNARLTQVSQELSRALAEQELAREAEITVRDARITRLAEDNTRLTQTNQELTQALAEQDRTRMADRADREARITQLAGDNTRLTQTNQELTQALAEQDRTRMTDRADREARIARLAEDNTRLTQTNQELTQALAEQDRTRVIDRTDREARITRLAEDNTRLTQVNQELSQALAEQDQRIAGDYQRQLTALEEDNRRLNQRIAEQVSALTQKTEEENKTADTANTYIALTNAYARYTASPGGIGDTESFFDTPEVAQTFPGFLDRLMNLQRRNSENAYQEGIANAASIIETALRIPQQDTRIKYLEGIRERYGSDPHISNLITMLLNRLF